MRLEGVIRDVRYTPHVTTSTLATTALGALDAKKLKGAFLLSHRHITVGCAYWVSPKRTRTYPLSRLYRTYHQPKRIAIIPIIKDEGASGNCDRINAVTFSWMNLANVFIVLAYYDDARRHPTRHDKLTMQTLNTAYLQRKLADVLAYQQTALHWNTTHFERDFVPLFETAVQRYQAISQALGVAVHSEDNHYRVLQTYLKAGRFDFEAFRDSSLPLSYRAAQREQQTTHVLEALSDGTKAYFYITNYLGGTYHLTADEVFMEGDRLIIQESKHANHRTLPALNDIQDGLFKLILFANLSELRYQGRAQAFDVRLKLTGNLEGTLTLPCDNHQRQAFVRESRLSTKQQLLVDLLQREALDNALTIELGGRRDTQP